MSRDALQMLARAQAAMQHSRALPDLAHRTFGRYSTVATDPFLDPSLLPWTPLLEEHYLAIREEAQQVLRVRDALPNFQDIAPDDITLSDDDQWKTFWFVGYNVWDDPNCLRCPRTAAVLRAIPEVTTAFFSILGPGKSLPPHHGPYRGVLRHHLALVVPEPGDQCWMEVGGQVRHWKEGRSMVFDDTYLHSAHNRTDGERVVLFIDVKRPLRQPVSAINSGLIKAVEKSPFIKRARAQHVAREAEFAAAWNAVVGRPATGPT